jgi:putative resolvase
VVLGAGELGEDLVRDMTGVLTWLCAGVYGRGPAWNRAEMALRCAGREVGPVVLSLAQGMLVS